MSDILALKGVRLAGRPANVLWDVICKEGCISSIQEHRQDQKVMVDERLLTPGLCHPHIHLDKCFLLSHPKFTDLEIQKGDFAEAMELTSRAKSRFEHDDLIERGRALIEESIKYGVTHMRAFVEVDAVVGLKCLEAGLELKAEFRDRCFVQICAFAQDPIFSQPDGGEEMCELMRTAAYQGGVDVVGSTPYVEKTPEAQRLNVEWMIALALKHELHLDYHLDYNLDPKTMPLVYHVISELNQARWPSQRNVTLGHCTRLTLFTAEEWHQLRKKIGDLPLSFVGLPTSDLFMMGRADETSGGGERARGTMQIPQMIKKYGLQAAVGVNNVGNAFTPQGSCDPLSVTSMGVAVYHAGTKEDANLLLACVSSRARAAIGLGSRTDIELKEGDTDLVIFGSAGGVPRHGFRHRTSVQELVYDACKERVTVFGGKVVSK